MQVRYISLILFFHLFSSLILKNETGFLKHTKTVFSSFLERREGEVREEQELVVNHTQKYRQSGRGLRSVQDKEGKLIGWNREDGSVLVV